MGRIGGAKGTARADRKSKGNLLPRGLERDRQGDREHRKFLGVPVPSLGWGHHKVVRTPGIVVGRRGSGLQKAEGSTRVEVCLKGRWCVNARF